MPPRIPDELREQIAEACRQPDAKRNDIARHYEVSPSTVSKIAGEVGATFDRTATKNATAAREADSREALSLLKARFIRESNVFLDKLHRPARLIELSKDGDWCVFEVEEPVIADQQRLMVSSGIAVDKAIAIDRHNAGVPDTTGLDQLMDIIGAAHQAGKQEAPA
jgi:transposase-like protein